MSDLAKIYWIVYVRLFSLALILLGLIGYSYNPEKALSALIMATGVGILVYISTYCFSTRIKTSPYTSKNIYLVCVSLYSLLVSWRAYLGWMAWAGGLEHKLVVSILLTTIAVFGWVTAWFMYAWRAQNEKDVCKIQPGLKEAVFAAGCFWGVQKAFQSLNGVVSTEAGYTGGWKDNPYYEEVCSGSTGHAEAVRIVYDPKNISYEQLLDYFWQIHDFTQLNRQGSDIGTQYRSAIFYSTIDERACAESKRQQLAGCVTEIVERTAFWPAEKYHQNYLK